MKNKCKITIEYSNDEVGSDTALRNIAKFIVSKLGDLFDDEECNISQGFNGRTSGEGVFATGSKRGMHKQGS